MKRLRARSVTILALLLIAVLAAPLWQSRPNSPQKHQDYLNASLLSAAMYGNAAAVQDLLRNGADPNSCQQPLSLKERLQRVCPAMHYIDHSDPQSLYETALGIAVLNGKPQVVRALLAGGADVQRKDSYGQTALDLANQDNDNSFLMLKEAARNRRPTEAPAKIH